MATIGDGVRIGFGLLLFRFLLGLGGCALALGTCAYLSRPDASPAAASRVQVEAEQREPPPPSSQPAAVMFRGGCYLRASPSASAPVVGQVTPGQTYDVHSQSGRWLRLELENGQAGWAGCRPTRGTR
jgi:hypothetical protein